MARERIATRAAVFEAADRLVTLGQKPTVAAVRDEIGGGSNTTIQDLLGTWRRERDREKGSGRELTPTGPVAGGRGLGAMPAVLPAQIEDLVHRFAYHLSRSWSDALADASPDDTLAVIRAAAEARVREAEDRVLRLEDTILDLEGELSMLRAERDGLATALDSAADRTRDAMAAEQRLTVELHDLQERSIARLEALLAERDELARMLEQMGRRPVLREASSGTTREIWPGSQARGDGSPGGGTHGGGTHGGGTHGGGGAAGAVPDPVSAVIPFPDTGKRGRDGGVEAARLSAEVDRLRRDRDAARTEIAKLSGERDALKQDLDGERRKLVATLGKERERHQGELDSVRGELEDLKVRAAKQSAWIREARLRMEKVGLLKPRKA